MAYLDTTGLTTLWNKIKATFGADLGSSTTATTASVTLKNKSATPATLGTATISAATTSAAGVMTADDKSKLNGIETGADVNVIETVKKNGTALTVTNKAVDISVPTTTNDLTNNSGFITKAVNDLTNYYTTSNTYTKTEVNNLIGQISSITFVVASSLPTASASTMNKIYLIPASSSETQNVKDEYITIESSGSYSWEKIGSTAVDLSNYVTLDGTQTISGSKTFNNIIQIGSYGKIGAYSFDDTVYLKTSDDVAGVSTWSDGDADGVLLSGSASANFKVSKGSSYYDIYHAGNLTPIPDETINALS